MQMYFRNGLHLFFDRFHLIFDPTNVYERDQCNVVNENEKIDAIFISHAHADHCNDLMRYLSKNDQIPIIAHPATFEILKDRDKIKHFISMSNTQINNEFEFIIEAFNAGHCLGSLQFRIAFKNKKFLYTGDINLNGSYTNKPANIMECNYLIIDSTLGDPSNVIESKEEIYLTIQEFIEQAFIKNKVVILYGYPLGIAQEMIYFINTFEKKEFNILADTLPFEITTVYEKYCDCIGNYKKLNNNLQGKKVIIANLSWVKYNDSLPKRLKIKNPPSLVLSNKEYNSMEHIWLTLHSDFNATMKYIHESKASTIFPCHGEHSKLNDHLLKNNIKSFDIHKNIYESGDLS